MDFMDMDTIFNRTRETVQVDISEIAKSGLDCAPAHDYVWNIFNTLAKTFKDSRNCEKRKLTTEEKSQLQPLVKKARTLQDERQAKEDAIREQANAAKEAQRAEKTAALNRRLLGFNPSASAASSSRGGWSGMAKTAGAAFGSLMSRVTVTQGQSSRAIESGVDASRGRLDKGKPVATDTQGQSSRAIESGVDAARGRQDKGKPVATDTQGQSSRAIESGVDAARGRQDKGKPVATDTQGQSSRAIESGVDAARGRQDKGKPVASGVGKRTPTHGLPSAVELDAMGVVLALNPTRVLSKVNAVAYLDGIFHAEMKHPMMANRPRDQGMVDRFTDRLRQHEPGLLADNWLDIVWITILSVFGKAPTACDPASVAFKWVDIPDDSVRLDGTRMEIHCSIARYQSEEADEALDPSGLHVPVTFALKSTAHYMQCSQAKIVVDSVRWPISRLSKPGSLATGGRNWNNPLDELASNDGTDSPAEADAVIWTTGHAMYSYRVATVEYKDLVANARDLPRRATDMIKEADDSMRAIMDPVMQHAYAATDAVGSALDYLSILIDSDAASVRMYSSNGYSVVLMETLAPSAIAWGVGQASMHKIAWEVRLSWDFLANAALVSSTKSASQTISSKIALGVLYVPIVAKKSLMCHTDAFLQMFAFSGDISLHSRNTLQE
ncbi:hypothetical protein T484DRAFT_1861836 [Baffinella frigidus]|nr:hypothetical protein T484DRAFT_1861836 [Cryptophyta sp. CCMP2293]